MQTNDTNASEDTIVTCPECGRLHKEKPHLASPEYCGNCRWLECPKCGHPNVRRPWQKECMACWHESALMAEEEYWGDG